VLILKRLFNNGNSALKRLSTVSVYQETKGQREEGAAENHHFNVRLREKCDQAEEWPSQHTTQAPSFIERQ